MASPLGAPVLTEAAIEAGLRDTWRQRYPHSTNWHRLREHAIARHFYQLGREVGEQQGNNGVTSATIENSDTPYTSTLANGLADRDPKILELFARADRFVVSLIPRADSFNGFYPLWHGWAINEGYRAGYADALLRGASVQRAPDQP